MSADVMPVRSTSPLTTVAASSVTGTSLNMELRHLEYFVAVAEELSFTRAAERLSMAQSPISEQVRKLERELGVTLFNRTTRSVELTATGRIFYDEARLVLGAAAKAADSARLAGQGRLGRLSLGFGGSTTYELMPQLVRAYKQRYPEVVLEVRSDMLTPPQVDALLDGTLSVGLLRAPVNAEGLVVEVMRDEPLVVLLPVTHPLASGVDLDLYDLRNEDFISYPSSPPSSVFLAVAAAWGIGCTCRSRRTVCPHAKRAGPARDSRRTSSGPRVAGRRC